MPFDLQGLLYTASIWVIPVLLAITLHEAAHGFVANLRGDSTARMLGRVTLNPLKHVDPFGTVVLPGLLLLVQSPVLFGYAKPVPVNANALRNPRRDMALVAAAGPTSNILMAVSAAILLHMVDVFPADVSSWVGANCLNAIRINAALAVINMLPLPPLDGGRVAIGVLPRPLARPLELIEPYGMMIFIGVLVLLPLIAAKTGGSFDAIDRLLFGAIDGVIHFIAVITGHV